MLYRITVTKGGSGLFSTDPLTVTEANVAYRQIRGHMKVIDGFDVMVHSVDTIERDVSIDFMSRVRG